MQPIIAHIELVVRDLDVSEQFYDKLLSLLGYDLAGKTRMGAKVEGARRALKKPGPVLSAVPPQPLKAEALARAKAPKSDTAAESPAPDGTAPQNGTTPLSGGVQEKRELAERQACPAPESIEYRHPLLTLRLRRAAGKPQPDRAGEAVRLSLRTQRTSEVDGLYHTVKRIGASMVHKPFEFWDGDTAYRAFQFHDPDGVLWEILHELDDIPDGAL